MPEEFVSGGRKAKNKAEQGPAGGTGQGRLNGGNAKGEAMTFSTSRAGLVAVALAATVFALTMLASAAHAQDYPAKPITLIVPFPAGGSTDITMRAIAEVAGKHLGQPVLIDNKSGGSGTVGPATMAASAKPDGYTIAQIPITVFRMPLMQQTPWDAEKDFTYIIHLTGYTFGVTASAEGPFKTW